MLKRFARLAAILFAVALPVLPAMVQAQTGGSLSDTFSGEELVESGQQFFGSAAQGLASVVERAVSEYGQPNGYVLGEEAGGALFIGAKYGEGTLYTRNAGQFSLYWQGPSIGLDVGGDGSKVMMLVYNLTAIQDILGRYPGVDGSAYVIGGVGMTVTKRADVVVVPIRSGVGARLGINVGYLNFTSQPTWNPF
jgi:hypothetical protein